MLLTLAERLESDGEELARLESLNVGKPWGVSTGDVEFSADNLRLFAGAARLLDGKAAGEYTRGLHQHDPAGTGWRRSLDRSLELPAPDDRVEDRAFYEPTVLAEVPEEAHLRREEIFGPVAPVFSVGSEEEAIRAPNATEYGLVAHVYTRDIKRVLRVIEGLETSMVDLNQGMVSNAAAPFGGVKRSGFGREDIE